MTVVMYEEDFENHVRGHMRLPGTDFQHVLMVAEHQVWKAKSLLKKLDDSTQYLEDAVPLRENKLEAARLAYEGGWSRNSSVSFDGLPRKSQKEWRQYWADRMSDSEAEVLKNETFIAKKASQLESLRDLPDVQMQDALRVIFSQEIEDAKARVQESLNHRNKPRGASGKSMRAFYEEAMVEEARLSKEVVDAEAGLAKAQLRLECHRAALASAREDVESKIKALEVIQAAAVVHTPRDLTPEQKERIEINRQASLLRRKRRLEAQDGVCLCFAWPSVL